MYRYHEIVFNDWLQRPIWRE